MNCKNYFSSPYVHKKMHWPRFLDLYCLKLLSWPVCANWDHQIRYVWTPLLIPTWCSELVQYSNVDAAFLDQMIKEILPDPSRAANSSFPPPVQPSIPAAHMLSSQFCFALPKQYSQESRRNCPMGEIRSPCCNPWNKRNFLISWFCLTK